MFTTRRGTRQHSLERLGLIQFFLKCHAVTGRRRFGRLKESPVKVTVGRGRFQQDGTWRTKQLDELIDGTSALLLAGPQHTRRNLLGTGTVDCTIASPGFASHGHQADRPLGEVIGGVQTRTA